MPFKERAFNKPTYSQEIEETKKIIIVSCEGQNTEPEYFQEIKNKLSTHMHALLEIEIAPKNGQASEPQNVLRNLEEYILEKYDFNTKFDSLWLLCDREKVLARKKHLEEIIPICFEKGYKIALSNPLFEFWLLLHVVDITEYDNVKLFDNVKVSNKHRLIGSELSKLLPGGFSKKKDRFNEHIVSHENLKRALQQEKRFATELELILDNLGSNVGDLIREIIDESTL